MAKTTTQQDGAIRALMEQVKELTEKMANIEAQIFDSRWESVGKNFEVVDGNVKSLHERLLALERRLDDN